MILQNDNSKIKIDLDYTYSLNSSDNIIEYDIVHNLLEYVDKDNYYKVLSISIAFIDNKSIKIALIGDKNSYPVDCALLEDNILSVLQNKIITQIDINNGNIINVIELNNNWINNAIYKYKDNYIICGEIEITMLNHNFEEIWRFDSEDIIEDIEINEEYIKLYCFEGNIYKLDFNGNKIN